MGAGHPQASRRRLWIPFLWGIASLPIALLAWRVGELIIPPLWHAFDITGGYSHPTAYVGAVATWIGASYLAWLKRPTLATFAVAFVAAVGGAATVLALWFLFWLVVDATVGIPT